MLDRVIAELEAKKLQRSFADERFIREQRILDELAPRLWREVRQSLQTECKAHPDYMNFEVHPDSYARIVCQNRKVLVVEYLSDSKRIVFECGEMRGECGVGLDGKNRAVLIDDEGKILPSVAYLAEEILTAALRLS